MALLTNFPEDILYLIIKECSPTDLLKLSMVNRRCHLLIEPQIYHTIDWTWDEHIIPPISQLLRSVLARPELATYIRSVRLTGETFHLPPFRMKLPPRIFVPDAERRSFVTTVRQSEAPNSEFWINRLGGNFPSSSWVTMDAVLALLLSQLSNLTSLHLGPNFTKDTTILGAMFQHALCNASVSTFSKFEGLKQVYFSPRIDVERRWGIQGNDEKPNNTLCALTFFYAPAIQHITATIEEPKIFKWPANILPTPSKLEYLDITLLREISLGKVLSQCTNLHTLKYNFYADQGCKQVFLMPAAISSADLTNSLIPVRLNVRSLVLTCYITDHDWDGHEMEPNGIQTPVTGFTEFDMLETFEVPYMFLLGNHPSDNIQLGSVLPRRLKTLKLTDVGTCGWHDEWQGWNGEIIQVIRNWLDNWRESTPLLERIEILDYSCENDSLDETFQALSESASIAILVKPYDDYRDTDWPRVFPRCSE